MHSKGTERAGLVFLFCLQHEHVHNPMGAVLLFLWEECNFSQEVTL